MRSARRCFKCAAPRDLTNAYVKKPVDFDAFVDALTGLVAFWLGLNEPPPND